MKSVIMEIILRLDGIPRSARIEPSTPRSAV